MGTSTETGVCRWWEPHSWSKWIDHADYQKSSTITKAVVEIGVVQQRRCKRCNALQSRQVPDNG